VNPVAFRRNAFRTLRDRLRQGRRFIQLLAGPRQTGKTTLARQLLASLGAPSHYASADEPTLRDRAWLEAQWELGRVRTRSPSGRRRAALLVIDEVQKVPNWSETVKRLWDEDSARRTPLRVVLAGSSPLLVQRRLSESLAGRFEIVRVTHWSYEEMKAAFGWDLEHFLYFGGYPGAPSLAKDRDRWARYIIDSLIETTISRDILLLSRVDKPALLRQLFHLACQYSGQVVSYNKMLGQLQDAGNTTTLAHYLSLLSSAGMVTGLGKFAGSAARQRGSRPKLLVLNTALMTALSSLDFPAARKEALFWGRLVESAVGAHLANGTAGTSIEVFYWRDRGFEVDYVLRKGKSTLAIEVKSGRRKGALPGMKAFAENYPQARKLLVGGDGIPLEEFLSQPTKYWLQEL
jgi:predicted AAA+ superfamily ATPase